MIFYDVLYPKKSFSTSVCCNSKLEREALEGVPLVQYICLSNNAAQKTFMFSISNSCVLIYTVYKSKPPETLHVGSSASKRRLRE